MNISILLDNTGDHPLFVCKLQSNDGKYRIEKSLRFAECRNFYQDFIVPGGVKLEASFPSTLRRSSLGVRLSDDLLMERRKALNTVKYLEAIFELLYMYT